MMGYDDWLEKPYQDAAREQEAFEVWCESEDRDPDDYLAWDAYEVALAEWEEDRHG